MKVVYVVEYFPPHVGGVETLFDELSRGVAEEHDVEILTTQLPGTPREEETDGRTVRRVPCLSRYSFAAKFPQAAKIMRDADIVHTTTFISAGTTWWANLLSGTPTVLTFHEVWRDFFFRVQNLPAAAVNYLMEGLICRLYAGNTVVTPSDYTRRGLLEQGLDPENVHTIYHGIDHETFNPDVEPFREFDHPTYLFFGRAGISKGLPYLLEAAEMVAEEVPDAKLLLMVGRDEDYRRIKPRIDELVREGIAVEIEPRESREEVAAVIRSSDVVCVPSLSEGFGFSAAEAQACGVPVVASRAGSLPEVVGGGELVEPENPESIGDSLIKLLTDKELREEEGEKGREFVERFTWEQSVESHLELYESMR